MGKRSDKRKRKEKQLREAKSYAKKTASEYKELYGIGIKNFDAAYEKLQTANSQERALRAQRQFEQLLNENLMPGGTKKVNINTLKDFFLKEDRLLPQEYEILKEDRGLKHALIQEFYDLQDEGYFAQDLNWKLNYYSSDRIIDFYYSTATGDDFNLFLDRARRRKQGRLLRMQEEEEAIPFAATINSLDTLFD